MKRSYTSLLKSVLLITVAVSFALIPDTSLAKGKKKKKRKKATAAQVAKPEITEQEKAREHYSKGKAAYEANDYSTALTEFKTAYEIKPHSTVLKSVAECMLRTGDILGAIEKFEEYMADPTASQKEEVKVRIEDANKMLGTVEISSNPQGAGVLVDGSVTDNGTPITIKLMPGEHEITFNLDDHDPIIKQVEVKENETLSLNVDFQVDANEMQPASLADPFADDDVIEQEKDGPPPAFWVAAAVAGIGLVSGTVFGTMALSAEDDYEKKPSDKDIKDSGERSALIADISFGTALVAAIVGTVILATNKSNEESAGGQTAARFTVSPVASEDTIGFATAITF